ncbi:DUF349 domain-containing protein [Tomitella biformata]|uniref:DUF349 domain-containing protein n=1 Tax=Tomitella biformata TaxID=630403 RepID=UPI00046505CD|nr:DUF349 domain-containing protein [Tomitella biformata]
MSENPTPPNQEQPSDKAPEGAGSASSPAPTPAPAAAAPSPAAAAAKPRIPGPRPSPGKPGPVAGAHPPAALHHTANNPAKFGRVDDEGNVFLKTADGERQIGSWQAGEPSEGLAHFGRRFEDLATEVELLEVRLSSGTADLRKTRSAASALLESLPTAAVLGDVDGLDKRLQIVLAGCEEAVVEARHRKDAQRVDQITRKEALAAEAEEIAAEASQWKVAGDRLREILDEWKTLRGIDRKTDDVLWKRYSKAREAFNRRRGAHFADLDRQRAGAKHRKEDLAIEAEKLAASTDWGPTAAAFRDLMAEWKLAGRAPRDTDDALWERFKQAQDTFFENRKVANAEVDKEFAANATAKESLLAEAERIDPATGLDSARAALRNLQERWEDIGKVPRERMHDLEGRLRAVETKVREAADQQWRRTDPEALARAAQFRDRVNQFEAQAAKAEAAGKAKDAEKARAQAKQWQEWADAAEGAVNER